MIFIVLVALVLALIGETLRARRRWSLYQQKAAELSRREAVSRLMADRFEELARVEREILASENLGALDYASHSSRAAMLEKAVADSRKDAQDAARAARDYLMRW